MMACPHWFCSTCSATYVPGFASLVILSRILETPMAMYIIEPDQRTLHGTFSRDIAPILTIDSGDTVRFRTLDSDWNLAPRQSTRYDEPPAQFTPRPAGQEHGHPLCGPIAIRGAQPGMTLAVQINAVRPGSWGFTAVGG